MLIKEHAGSFDNEEPHERQIRKIVAELMENPAEGEERAHILEKLHRIEVLIKEHAGSFDNEEPHERQIRKIVAELMEKARYAPPQ